MDVAMCKAIKKSRAKLPATPMSNRWFWLKRIGEVMSVNELLVMLIQLEGVPAKL